MLGPGSAQGCAPATPRRARARSRASPCPAPSAPSTGAPTSGAPRPGRAALGTSQQRRSWTSSTRRCSTRTAPPTSSPTRQRCYSRTAASAAGPLPSCAPPPTHRRHPQDLQIVLRSRHAKLTRAVVACIVTLGPRTQVPRLPTEAAVPGDQRARARVVAHRLARPLPPERCRGQDRPRFRRGPFHLPRVTRTTLAPKNL